MALQNGRRRVETQGFLQHRSRGIKFIYSLQEGIESNLKSITDGRQKQC